MSFRNSFSILLALVGTLTGSGNLLANGVLSLDEAIDTAMENSRTLLIADTELRETGYRLDEAKSGRLPRLTADAHLLRTNNPTAVFSNKLNQQSFTQADFDVSVLNDPDPSDDIAGFLRLYQPIYTGGRTRRGIDGADEIRASAEAGRERTRQEVVQQVIEAYSHAVLARLQEKVARESLKTADANVELVADLREGGLVVESDLLQARVRRAEVEELLIRAVSTVAIADAGLNLVMGVDLDTPVKLPSTVEVQPLPDESLEALLDSARDDRPDLEAVSHQGRAAELQARSARSGRRPEIGFAGVAEAHSADLFGSYGSNWSLRLGLRWDLFDGNRTKKQVREATERTRRAELQREQLERHVGLEVRRGYYELRAAHQRMGQAGEAVELAEESLRIVRDRYGEGLTTLVELLDSETFLTRARTREVAARRDVLISAAVLDLAAGRL